MEKTRAIQVYIVLGLIVMKAAAKQAAPYQRVSSLDDLVDLTNIIKTTVAKSVLQCTRYCDQDNDCVAFYFTPSTKECQHQRMFSSDDMFVKAPKPGSRYYQKYVPATFACPVQNGDWVTNQLPDGSVAQYMVDNSVVFNQADATAYCEARGSHLIKLTTAEKMTFYLNNIIPCPDVYGFQFWVDGKNTPTNPDHITHDGEVVPLISELWYPDRPNNLVTQNCIHSWQPTFNYMLDDIFCSRADYQIICERLVM